MSDSTIAKMIKELKDKIEELEQQLAEQVAYGEELCNRLVLIKSFESTLSQDLVNNIKAQTIEEIRLLIEEVIKSKQLE